MHHDLPRLSILHYPDPRLRQPAAPVREFGPPLRDLADRMLELMRQAAGVGLAAPQVGLPLRLFVMNPGGEDGRDLVLVNPEVLGRSGNVEAEEGCLSLPGVNVTVRRAKRCRVRFQDLDGRPQELEGEDLIARIWQHETDHLDGVLIIDRMGPSDRMATRKTLRALEQGVPDRRAESRASATHLKLAP